MERVLVIAYGNPLRCDDGIAWQAAEELRRELPKDTRVICVHQLTPELAEDASRADLVIFLDASSNGEPGSFRCEAVSAQASELHFSHHITPKEVLSLSNHLYAAEPRAFLISIHGKCFDHGQELSPAPVHALPQVVARICALIKHLTQASATA